MKILIVIPVIDEHDTTDKCIEYIKKTSITDPSILLIDNGSSIPYTDRYSGVLVDRSEENRGLLGSLQRGLEHGLGYTAIDGEETIIVFPHNDVLIHEYGWDKRVIDAFQRDPALGMAGFFGARGMGKDGGRWQSESAMMGFEWGSSWMHHSAFSNGVTPAANFDGLCLIFRGTALGKIGIPDGPPHHWYDRFLPLHFISNGWRCATIGIAHDHRGGVTASKQAYADFAKKWCDSRGIPAVDGNYDMAIYNEGLKLFNSKWVPRLPIKVDNHYNYTWNSK